MTRVISIPYRKRQQNNYDFEIGDFAMLPNAQNYYDASLTFVDPAKQKIKALAES